MLRGTRIASALNAESQREDRIDGLIGDRVADSLDEGQLAAHHGGAEAEEDERSPLVGRFLRAPCGSRQAPANDAGQDSSWRDQNHFGTVTKSSPADSQAARSSRRASPRPLRVMLS